MGKKVSKTSFSFTIFPRDDDEIFDVEVHAEISPDFPEEEIEYFQDVLRGLIAHMHTGLEMTHFIGSNMRALVELEDQVSGISLEPDPELVTALNKEAAEKLKSNIIQFKKKLH